MRRTRRFGCAHSAADTHDRQHRVASTCHRRVRQTFREHHLFERGLERACHSHRCPTPMMTTEISRGAAESAEREAGHASLPLGTLRRTVTRPASMVPVHSPRTQRLGVYFCSQSFCATCWGTHFIWKRTRRSIERAPAGTPSGDADVPGGWLPLLTFDVG